MPLHKLGSVKLLSLFPSSVRNLLNLSHKRSLQKSVNISDLRLCAKNRSHKMVFDYLDAGADDEVSLRRGKDAFVQLEMHYHVLSGVEPPLDMSTTIFGKKAILPFFTCPCAGQKMFHKDGELAVAKSCEKNGMAYGLSSLTTTPITEIMKHHSGPKVFQLYVWKDRALVRDVLAKARDGGFDALALTVDFTWYGNRERDVRNNFTIPPNYSVQQIWEAAKKVRVCMCVCVCQRNRLARSVFGPCAFFQLLTLLSFSVLS